MTVNHEMVSEILPSEMPLAEEVIVTTFPIGARSEAPKVGLVVPPLIGFAIARNMGGIFVPAINTLDSYKTGREKFVPPYLEALGNAGIAYEDVWHDAEQVEALSGIVSELHEKGYLRAETREVDCCPCGKVERLSTAVTQKDARLYAIGEDGSTTCKECSGVCAMKTADVLVMHFPDSLQPPVVEPPLMRGEVAELTKRLSGMEYLASRTNRNTSIEMVVDGKPYQLDVDFFWSNYLATLPAGGKVAVGTSHVQWHMSLAHGLLQCSRPDQASQTSLVLAPYITAKTPFGAQAQDPERGLGLLLEQQDPIVPLFMLKSLVWSRQGSDWSPEALRLLQSKPQETLRAVWGEVSRRKNSGELEAQQAALGKTALQVAIASINPTSIDKYLSKAK